MKSLNNKIHCCSKWFIRFYSFSSPSPAVTIRKSLSQHQKLGKSLVVLMSSTLLPVMDKKISDTFLYFHTVHWIALNLVKIFVTAIHPTKSLNKSKFNQAYTKKERFQYNHHIQYKTRRCFQTPRQSSTTPIASHYTNRVCR